MPKLYKSVLMCELFQPIMHDEAVLLDAAERIIDQGDIHMLEIAPLYDKKSRNHFRNLIEQNNMQSLLWGAHLLWAENLNTLSSLDKVAREQAVRRTLYLLDLSVETGCTYLGVPPGDDPGEALRSEGKKALADSLMRIAEVAEKYNMKLLLEPMDRYAHKKAIIGPINEAVEWIAPIHDKYPNVFLHWDSAHEYLGEIDLIESLNITKDYMASFHLANAIKDHNHPYFGDWHMDIGQAPDFETEGFLNLEVGANILKEAASFPALEGNECMHVSLEIRSHMGNDCWRKYNDAKAYLDKCFELAKLN